MCYSWCIRQSQPSQLSFQIPWFYWFSIYITPAGRDIYTAYRRCPTTCGIWNIIGVSFKCGTDILKYAVLCRHNWIALIAPRLNVLILFTQNLPGDHHGQTAQAFHVVLFVVALFTLTWSGVCTDQTVYPSGLEIILPCWDLVECIQVKEI